MSIVNALVAFISLCLIGFEIWVYVANPFQNGLNFVMGQASKIKTAAERKSETEEALEKDIAEAGVGVAAAAGGCGVIAVLYIISLIATCFEVLFIIYALVAHIGDPLVAWAAIALFIIGIGVGLIEGQHISKQMEAAKAEGKPMPQLFTSPVVRTINFLYMAYFPYLLYCILFAAR